MSSRERADVHSETERVAGLLRGLSETHPRAAQRLFLDFQDSRYEYEAQRMPIADLLAELAGLERQVDRYAGVPAEAPRGGMVRVGPIALEPVVGIDDDEEAQRPRSLYESGDKHELNLRPKSERPARSLYT